MKRNIEEMEAATNRVLATLTEEQLENADYIDVETRFNFWKHADTVEEYMMALKDYLTL